MVQYCTAIVLLYCSTIVVLQYAIIVLLDLPLGAQFGSVILSEIEKVVHECRNEIVTQITKLKLLSCDKLRNINRIDLYKGLAAFSDS